MFNELIAIIYYIDNRHRFKRKKIDVFTTVSTNYRFLKYFVFTWQVIFLLFQDLMFFFMFLVIEN